jgi:ribosome recycling factor
VINEIKKDTQERMDKSLESLHSAFNKIRTGRAHPSILDAIKVDYYGSELPIGQAANVNVEDSRTLVVIPWEKTMVPVIEKAIMKSDLGLNPSTAGSNIRIPMPALTEETRKGYIKQARAEAENARIAIRNIRRDANTHLKALMKDKEISEDEERRAQEDIQKVTDKHTAEIDKLLTSKEEDLMQI